MKALRVIPNIHAAEGPADREFFGGFLGLGRTVMDQGWVARLTSPDSGAEVQLVTRDRTAPEDSVVTVMVDDVGAAHDEALRRGYEIVHPLTTEDWGVRRFFVRAPGGAVVNVAQHHPET
ncbi:MAG: VOC family protein [Nakamurella sp.]